ncbi:MAG: beta-ketoacyl-ACP synthase II [Planctomycetes bacterium]|nr:beta-ketoacyl-ACP synthase II [Planctomycetota bacterium]
MTKRRVVVTGIGVISPVGHDRETAWAAVREGRSGVKTITAFDTSEFDVRIAGEIQDFDPLQHFDKRKLNRRDRFVQFALVAAEQAIGQARLDFDREDRSRIGAFIGTGIGGLHEIESQHTRLVKSGPRRTSPLMIPKLMTNAAAGQVAMRYNIHGPSMSISSACASSSHAIAEAVQSIRWGTVDVQLCGGSEAALTPLGLSGFQQMKALSTRNDDPPGASRPFDASRDGFVMAEGAAILILEDLDHARARAAEPLAEIAGYGASSDAYHITLPEPEGKGAALAMRNALADAGLQPEQIDYVNAHGTGTQAGDSAEAQAIVRVFGDHAQKLAISSSKSVFGHLLGASGALESAVCIWALQDNIVPPTINLTEPDPDCCGLDFVPNEARQRELHTVISNSFGFGGHNVSLVIRKFAD